MHRVILADTDQSRADATPPAAPWRSRSYRSMRFVAASFALIAAIATMGCPSGRETEAATDGGGGAPTSPGRASAEGTRDLTQGREEFNKNLEERHKKRAEAEERSRKELEEEDRKAREELAAIEKLPAAERAARMKELEARKKKEEWVSDGLVLKLDSLEGTRNSIKGVVVNRRKDAVSQATITFDLFDSKNAHIGVASATIDDFKPNTKWNFEVNTTGREVGGFKPKALTGF